MALTTQHTDAGSARLLPKPWCVDGRRDQAGLAWVLLVDDDPCNTRALSRWVRAEFGLETRAARTIADAECWLRSMPRPLAVITDFDLLAGENGAQVIRHLRAVGVDVPAIVVTGAPARAEAALWRSGVQGVSVLPKAQYHDPLRAWLVSQGGAKAPRVAAGER